MRSWVCTPRHHVKNWTRQADLGSSLASQPPQKWWATGSSVSLSQGSRQKVMEQSTPDGPFGPLQVCSWIHAHKHACTLTWPPKIINSTSNYFNFKKNVFWPRCLKYSVTKPCHGSLLKCHSEFVSSAPWQGHFQDPSGCNRTSSIHLSLSHHCIVFIAWTIFWTDFLHGSACLSAILFPLLEYGKCRFCRGQTFLLLSFIIAIAPQHNVWHPWEPTILTGERTRGVSWAPRYPAFIKSRC